MVCLVYLDDIIVQASALGAHLERLTWLFERLRNTGPTLKCPSVEICRER